MKEELGDANVELQIIFRSLLNNESTTMIRGGRGGEQQAPFTTNAESLLAYVGQLEQKLIKRVNEIT